MLEQHQSAYEKRTTKKRIRQGKGKERKLVITKDYVFLPRFQYNLSKYKTTKTIATRARVTLSPHLVSGHIRNLPTGHKASEEALENAREFGLQISDGQTFVRPHERGEIEQLRTYRSRSALELLFADSQA